MNLMKLILIAGLVSTITVTTAYAVQFNGSEGNGKVKIKMPETPEIWDVYPNIEKEKYQPQVQLQDQQQDVKETSAHSEETFRSFVGFNGPYSTEEIAGDAALVIDHSLNISDSGTWKAAGLVRNETIENAGNMEVEAVLYSKSGEILDQLKTTSFVEEIRPGEPAPFQLESSVLAEDVGRVEWKASVIHTANKYSRDQVIQLFYEYPYGTELNRTSSEAGGFPYELVAGFMNLGEKITKEKLVAAWLTPEGKVFHIEEASMNAAFDRGIDKGEAANFDHILVADGKVAAELNEYQYMLWAVGE